MIIGVLSSCCGSGFFVIMVRWPILLCVQHEGLGVLHIVFVGPFLPYDALSAYWQTLTGCWSVSVSEVRDFTRISWEMTRQHMRCRYSQSRDWLPKGLMSYWVYFKRVRPYDSWYEFVYMYPHYAPFVLETSRQVYLPV